MLMDILPSRLACHLHSLDACVMVSGGSKDEYFLGIHCYDVQDLMYNFSSSFEYSDPWVCILDREKMGLTLIGMLANDYTHKPTKKNIAKCWFTHLVARLPEKEGKWHGYSKWPFW